MEKIEQALAKARRHREQQQPDTLEHVQATSRSATAATPDNRPPRYRSTRVNATDTNSLKERRVVAGLGDMELADAFRILRTRVIQRLSAAGGTTLAITSSGMSEGKTVVAANLAISLSQFAHHTVLLVDVDLRRPGVHKVFAVNAEPGLTDYLLSDTPLSECLVNPGIERLVLLPSGAPLTSSSEMLSTDKVTALAAELKSRYPNRLVLYDLPPLLPSDDALVFLKHVDASLLVVEEGKTQRSDIERALHLLDGHNPIGTVLNKAQATKGDYGYY